MKIITPDKLKEHLGRQIAQNPNLKHLLSQFKDNPKRLEEILSEITKDVHDRINPYRWEPVTPKEFINSPYYCGTDPNTGIGVAGTMYPKLKDDFYRIHDLDAGTREVILTGCVDVNAIICESDGGLPTLSERIGKDEPVQILRDGIENSDTLNTRFSGVMPVISATLRNGMRLKLTPDHKVQVFDRKYVWREAKDLRVGDRVITPRIMRTAPSMSTGHEESRLLAYVMTNGSYDSTRLRFSSNNEHSVKDFLVCIRSLGFDGTVRFDPKKSVWEFHSTDFAKSGLRDYAFGVIRKYEGIVVPEKVCKSGNDAVANFIGAAMCCEGCVYFPENGVGVPRIQISMIDERFVRQLQLLLLRFGIQSRIRHLRQFDKRKNRESFIWELSITGKASIESYFDRIGMVLGKEDKCLKMMAHFRTISANTNVDVLPFHTDTLKAITLKHCNGVPKNSSLWGRMYRKGSMVSRETFDLWLDEYGETKMGRWMRKKFSPDLSYVEISRIEMLNEPIPVGDIGALDGNRFIANGFGVHNSIGWGKSLFMEIGLLWNLYILSCLRNPQKYFRLAPASTIAVMVLSLTEKQAKKNVFGTVREMVKVIPYFNEQFRFDDKRDTESLIFPNCIEFFLGTSSKSAAIGLNIYAACLDEANFFKIIEKSKRAGQGTDGTYDEALTLYNSLLRRQESRFLKEGLKPGILYVGSSRMYPNDFTEQRIRKVRESGDTHTQILDYNLWTVNRERYSSDEFMVEVGAMSKRNRIVDGTETDISGEILNIPMDFYDVFRKDIDNALRDIAGVAVYSIQPFIGQKEHIKEMFDESIPRAFSVDTATLSPKPEYTTIEKILGMCKSLPSRRRYIGLDIGLKKDSFGFAMGYVEDLVTMERDFWDDETQKFIKTKQQMPSVVIEMVLRIIPEMEFGEVELGRVRFLIFQLRQMGYKVGYSSADGFQSKDMEQILNRKGIHHDYISMDKTNEPYETFRTAMYEGRVKCIYHEVLERELNQLERNFASGKIDHPPKGSKDLSDAVGQVVYNCHIRTSFMDDAMLGFSSGTYNDEVQEESIEDIAKKLNDWVQGKQKKKPVPESAESKENIIK